MNTFAFTLDLSKAAYMEPLRIRQGDHNGTTVQATILDHGVALDGSYTARFCMRHPGTGATYYRETGTYANGVATIALDEQYAASVPGRTTAYIQLLQGSTVIASTSDIPVVILHDATEDAVPGEVYDSAIEDALAELDEATGRISVMVQEQVAEELAAHPEWTTTVQDNSLTDAKLVQSGGILSRNARLMYRLANLLTHRTDEGTLAAISDAAKTPMAGLTVYGQSTQDGTPTPETPVPIVSVTGDSEGNISLWAHGFNWWDEQWEQGSIVTSTGANSTNNTRIRSRGYIPITPSREYYFKMPNNSYVYFYGSSGDYIGYYAYPVSGKALTPSLMRNALEGGGSFADAAYMRFRCDSVTTYDNDICINLSDPSHNGEYQPYIATVTPIDLDGHELRSLPDGTRDELTVDAEGHVTLVQRVGTYTVTGSETLLSATDLGTYYRAYAHIYASDSPQRARAGTVSGYCTHAPFISGSYSVDELSVAISINAGTGYTDLTLKAAVDTSEALLAAYAGAVITYPLAEPITYDLGTVPLVPLVGPDLTAQTVPTAPFVLDAERDLNVTLARLESAIAALA